MVLPDGLICVQKRYGSCEAEALREISGTSLALSFGIPGTLACQVGLENR